MTWGSREERRASYVRHRYSLTLIEYDALKADAQGACQLCLQPQTRLGAWQARGRLTGWTCWPCRTLLSHLRRWPPLLPLLEPEARARAYRLLSP